MVEIYLVRHGKTDWNEKGWMQGHTDIELNAEGIAQAEELKNIFDASKMDVCFASPMKRAKKTAEILVDGKLDIVFDERLIERGFGEYEGTKPDMDLLKRHWDYKLNDSEKGVESLQDCIKRAEGFLEYVKENCQGKKVLIVSHGCTIKAMHFICEGYDENTDFLSFFPHNSKVYSYKLNEGENHD